MKQMDINDSIKATKHGAYAAFFSAGITVLIVFIAMGSEDESLLAYWADPFSLLDIPIVLGFAIGMLAKSRVAAALAFIYHLSNQILIRVELQSYLGDGFAGVGFALLFLFLYARAFAGAVNYHKIKTEQDPTFNVSSIFSRVFASLSVIVVVTLIVISFSFLFSDSLPTKVLKGDEVPESYLTLLHTNNIVTTDEKILYFYPNGVSDVLESGNILTDKNVILYMTEENGELSVYSLFVTEITEIIQEVEGNAFRLSEYMIIGENEDRWLKLFLSSELNRDKSFISALKAFQN